MSLGQPDVKDGKSRFQTEAEQTADQRGSGLIPVGKARKCEHQEKSARFTAQEVYPACAVDTAAAEIKVDQKEAGKSHDLPCQQKEQRTVDERAAEHGEKGEAEGKVVDAG